jgi:hypothetical protein
VSPTRSRPAASRPAPIPSRPEEPASAWHPVTLAAFRFSVVYLGLFVLVTQISGSMTPNLTYYYRGLGRLWPMRDITLWIASHVLGITPGPEEWREGGEPVVFWVQASWVFAAAVIATAIWSVVDRRRRHYATLHKWFRLFVRFALAASMFEYGMTKVIPTQFPAPSLTTLVTPTGQLTLSALLWTAIGSSPPYEIFTGCVELLGGILLLTPRTTLLGALICLAATTQVFVLNMTFDIGVKLVSLHLMLLALFLLAPDLNRLADVFIWNRPASASPEAPLMRTIRGNRIAGAAQIAFGIYLLAMFAHINLRFWEVGGGGRPRSALYGVWDVEQLSVDGEIRPADVHEYDRRWRRVIFDAPDTIVFQRTDDSFARYGASIDENRRTLALSKGGSRTWKGSLSYERPSPDRLIVEGDMDGHRIVLQLRQTDFDTFRLLNSTFRWVRPHDP